MIQQANSPKQLSIADLHAMKSRQEKITCLTVYDASFSALIDKLGVEVMLVGDSLGMVIQGHTSTLPVTMDQMVYHTRCVCQAREQAFVIADLPFMSYSTPQIAADNAARLLREAGAQMVKLEGARTEIVSFLVAQGVPVCGHLGLLPQSINLIGEYKAYGKTAPEAKLIIEHAEQLENAGASLLLLECVPAYLAKSITQQVKIPVIGIGAGIDCDGQILVLYDMLNIGLHKKPRFSKDFLFGSNSIETAIAAYRDAVKQGTFPSVEHSY